jgi:hypothetical protein
MKVKELIQHLSKCNQEADVVISTDEEGNHFNLLADDGIVTDMTYDAKEVLVYGVIDDVYYKKLTPEQRAKGYGEGDELTIEDGGIECIVLYP